MAPALVAYPGGTLVSGNSSHFYESTSKHFQPKPAFFFRMRALPLLFIVRIAGGFIMRHPGGPPHSWALRSSFDQNGGLEGAVRASFFRLDGRCSYLAAAATGLVARSARLSCRAPAHTWARAAATSACSSAAAVAGVLARLAAPTASEAAPATPVAARFSAMFRLAEGGVVLGGAFHSTKKR